MIRFLLVSAAFLQALAAPAAEVISLNEGPVIKAEIIREFPDRVIVNLGYDLLTIPRQHIRTIEKEEAAEAASKPTGAAQASGDLYSTANLPTRTVKELVERFGEGVVLVSTPSALGSGFFTDAEGYLITNVHVIEGETKIAVTVFRKVAGEFKRQKFEEVDIIATNPFLDLALLKVNLPADYKPVITYLDTDSRLREGDTVFAIGNPLGLERSVSQGIISRRNRADQGLVLIQTTAQINQGNSGGPLFNTRGEVIGVANLKLSGIGVEGVAFAIPVRYVIDFLRNREAFAYNSESSVAGYRYLQPAERMKKEAPPMLKQN